MKIVIIGGGPAGISAASAARKKNSDTEIVVYTTDKNVAYAPCAIPFVIGGEIKMFKDIILHDIHFYEKNRNILINTETVVKSIDLYNKSIRIKNNYVRYDKLILATGSMFIVPQINGIQLKGIFIIKCIEDGENLSRFLSKLDGRNIVVFGAGPLGIEMAVALRKKGLSVTILEKSSNLFQGALDTDILTLIEEKVDSLGIKAYYDINIKSLIGENGYIKKILTNEGEFDADAIILATKIKPNTDLAINAEIKIGSSGGIYVDDYLQTSDIDVYAAGDCVESTFALTGEKIPGKFASTAVMQGKIAGINAVGGSERFNQVTLPWVVPIDDIVVGGVGLTMERAQKTFKPNAVTLISSVRARYYASSDNITMKLVIDRNTHQILGAEIIGTNCVKERLDFMAYLISKKATAEDLRKIETCYAPKVAKINDIFVLISEELMEKINI